ncbi:MAG: serine hydrolase [Clostridiales bacterium]|nr:serine hydrolase [Clostridiales bacterium]
MIKAFLDKSKELNVNIDSIYLEENDIITKEIINDIELHELRSCSKLLIAFAYGIALNENFKCKYTNETLNLNTKIYPTLSAIYNGQIPKQVKEWTIRTLLTHSTGYEKMMFNEKHIETLDKNNLLDVLFNTEIKYKTGEHFTYSNVEPYLLSIFFQESFDQNIADFVNERIFKPLDIKNFKWLNLGKYCAGATGLTLNHSDFHKLGQLLMNNGKRNEIQVVPAEWIKEMTSKQVECPDYYKPERVLPKLSAGYHTWISRDNILFRDGSNGQYIICDYKNNRLITIMATQKDMSLVTECLRGLI